MLIDLLETRRLLAADPVVLQPDGTLVLTGIAGNDEMNIVTVSAMQKLIVYSRHQTFENNVVKYPEDFREHFDLTQVSRIEVHAGQGNDVVRLYADIPAEIWGDAGNDALFAWGTDGNSSTGFIVHGGDGRDNISTGDGNDTLFGDASPDELFSHGGNDLISGGGGGDVLHGYAGRDRIYGGEGSDLICGEEGADKLDGAGGNDTLLGGGGNDILIGGAGTDRLIGDRGDDVFVTNDSEADTLIGGSGNDDTASVDQILDLVS